MTNINDLFVIIISLFTGIGKAITHTRNRTYKLIISSILLLVFGYIYYLINQDKVNRCEIHAYYYKCQVDTMDIFFSFSTELDNKDPIRNGVTISTSAHSDSIYNIKFYDNQMRNIIDSASSMIKLSINSTSAIAFDEYEVGIQSDYSSKYYSKVNPANFYLIQDQYLINEFGIEYYIKHFSRFKRDINDFCIRDMGKKVSALEKGKSIFSHLNEYTETIYSRNNNVSFGTYNFYEGNFFTSKFQSDFINNIAVRLLSTEPIDTSTVTISIYNEARNTHILSIYPEPDYNNGTLIKYTSKDKIKDILTNKLFIYGEDIRLRKRYTNFSFLLATLIAACLSILIDSIFNFKKKI